jgi:hypothetical protein
VISFTEEWNEEQEGYGSTTRALAVLPALVIALAVAGLATLLLVYLFSVGRLVITDADGTVGDAFFVKEGAYEPLGGLPKGKLLGLTISMITVCRSFVKNSISLTFCRLKSCRSPHRFSLGWLRIA